MIIQGSEVNDHIPAFMHHFSELSSDDRYNRFSNTLAPCAIESWLLSLADNPRQTSQFAVSIGDNGEFAGVGQIGIVNGRSDAEVSISVIPSKREQGLGYELISSLKEIARQKGITKLTFTCENSNYNCRKLFTKLGFISKHDSDLGCVSGYYHIGSTK